MELSVKELTSVDKEIVIKANREDLAEKFNNAYKKYRAQIQMPGFRPGKVPLGLIKKRFGQEIELEEINNYVQEVYEKEIVPEHEPVGETEMTDMSWENDELEVTFKIGARPQFELVDLSSLTFDQMVHDVTDEEVEEEIQRTLDRQGNWEEVEDEITEEHRVTVDAVTIGEDGEPIEEERDENQVLDLRQESAKEFREHLVGKKTGDKVEMKLGEGDELDHFEMEIKKVEKMNQAELTDEFAKEASQGMANNVDEFRSFIKSNMQQYYDQTSKDMFRQEAIDKLTKAHDFEIPEVMKTQVLNQYVEMAKQQSGGELPAGFDVETYKANMGEQAIREAKWAFISQALQEKFDDIEITAEDIDEFIGIEAARFGVTADQLKSFYAQDPGQLENLRTSIRENKLFEKLADEVALNELSREEFNDKKEAEAKEEEEANASQEAEESGDKEGDDTEKSDAGSTE
ncbi:MAG TPA: trigger factor [Balneolaceae bacterium]|nr:trigger factor [Balneolaceae bacterium]